MFWDWNITFCPWVEAERSRRKQCAVWYCTLLVCGIAESQRVRSTSQCRSLHITAFVQTATQCRAEKGGKERERNSHSCTERDLRGRKRKAGFKKQERLTCSRCLVCGGICRKSKERAGSGEQGLCLGYRSKSSVSYHQKRASQRSGTPCSDAYRREVQKNLNKILGTEFQNSDSREGSEKNCWFWLDCPEYTALSSLRPRGTSGSSPSRASLGGGRANGSTLGLACCSKRTYRAEVTPDPERQNQREQTSHKTNQAEAARGESSARVSGCRGALPALPLLMLVYDHPLRLLYNSVRE